MRWLQQEQVQEVTARVIKEDLLRFDNLPLVQRLPGLPDNLVSGETLRLGLVRVDALTMEVEWRLIERLTPPAVAVAPAADATEAAEVPEGEAAAPSVGGV